MSQTVRILLHLDQAQPDYTIQRRGQWLVVPVVMMTEGVRSGSGGPILHLAQYYSQDPEAWNGTPVTAGHPINSDDQFVSVNSVDQDRWVVGHLRNARAEDGKLKADVYLNEQRTIAVNPEILNYLNEQRKLDVSIGAFTQDQPEQGEYEQREYQAVTVSYTPDHLALLPGEQGACSWADGCGIRNNKKEESYDMKDIDEHFKALKERIKEGKGVEDHLQDNEAGFIELSQRIQSMLDRRDSEAQIHFLKEVYDDHFVYEVRNRDQGTQKFYRQDYTFNESQNDVDLTGDRQEVRRNVEYVPVQSNKENCGCTRRRTKHPNTNKTDSTMEKEKNTQPSGEVMEKVVGLVNNEQTHFTKSDRSWLLELNTDQLEKLEPKEAPEPVVNKEQAIQALSEDLADIETAKELLPEDVKAKVELGLKSYEEVRSELIKSIQANTSEEDWPTETLQDMSTDNLKRLNKSVKRVDYSGQGPVNNSNGEAEETEEVLLPAGVGKE